MRFVHEFVHEFVHLNKLSYVHGLFACVVFTCFTYFIFTCDV